MQPLGQPVAGRGTVDLPAFVAEPAAQRRHLVGQDNPGASAAGDERRHQPGGTAADHQHVAEGMRLS